jgi:cobalt-zinc-cadmium efflux system membrane fusion protein
VLLDVAGRCGVGWLFALGLLSTLGCGGRPPAGGQSLEPARPRVVADGVVEVPDGSLAHLTLETTSFSAGSAALELPARVLFRDTAVSRIGSPVSGRVMRVHVNLGDVVVAGQPVLSVKSPDAASARAELRSTEEALQVARLAAQRASTMFAQGVATERERAEAELSVVRLESDAARARVTAEFVGSGRAGDVEIRSPIAGTVIARMATVGAEVSPASETLIEIGDPNALLVEADVFERDLGLVQAGAKAKVELSSMGDALEGTVLSVGAAVDPLLRTASVRIALNGVGVGLMRPGMYGRATILSTQPSMSVPSTAVLVRNGVENVVYVATGAHQFTRRRVHVGRSIDGRVQVLSGLREGERVVVRGGLLLDAASDQLI